MQQRIIKTTISEAFPMVDNSNARYIRLLDDNKNAVFPFNVKLDQYNERKIDVKKYIDSESTPNGRYYIEAKNVKASKGSTLYEIEKVNGVEQQRPSAPAATPTTPAQPLEDKATPAIEHFSIEELISIKIENEKLKLQNSQLENEIDELNDYIDQLEKEPEASPLEDNPNNKFSFLKDLAKELLPVADEFFQNEREKRQIELANIGLQKQQIDMMNQPRQMQQMPQMRVEPDQLTLEQLTAMKESAPQEFYNWYAQPGNAEYFDNLINNEQNAAS